MTEITWSDLKTCLYNLTYPAEFPGTSINLFGIVYWQRDHWTLCIDAPPSLVFNRLHYNYYTKLICSTCRSLLSWLHGICNTTTILIQRSLMTSSKIRFTVQSSDDWDLWLHPSACLDRYLCLGLCLPFALRQSLPGTTPPFGRRIHGSNLAKQNMIN